MAKKAKSTNTKDSSANLGFEAKLWLAADKLRSGKKVGGKGLGYEL